MKLDDLVEVGRSLIQSGEEELVHLGEEIIEMFAEAPPCGWELPTITSIPKEDPSWVRVPTSWKGVVRPEDARHMARMLLRAADEAER